MRIVNWLKFLVILTIFVSIFYFSCHHSPLPIFVTRTKQDNKTDSNIQNKIASAIDDEKKKLTSDSMSKFINDIKTGVVPLDDKVKFVERLNGVRNSMETERVKSFVNLKEEIYKILESKGSPDSKGIQSSMAITGIALAMISFLFSIYIVIFERERFLNHLENLTGVKVGLNRRFIRVILAGKGGVGKSTFVRRIFCNHSTETKETKTLKEYKTVETYGNKNYRLSVIDYMGQKHGQLFEKVSRLHGIREKIDFLVVILSFYPVGENGKINFPLDRNERKTIQNEHVNSQIRTYNREIVSQILERSKGLKGIFLLFNQYDLINTGRSLKEITEYSERIFREILEIVTEEVKDYNTKNNASVEVKKKYICAERSTEIVYDENEESHCIAAIKIVEDFFKIFKKGKETHEG